MAEEMQKREISVGFTYTANLGNYESAKIFVSTSRQLKPDEDEEEVIDGEFELIQEKVFEKIDIIIDGRK